MLVLIDGHNLIAQMPNIHLNEADDEAKLILELRRYRARTGHQIEVVFDSGEAYSPAERTTQGGVTVRFARRGISADRLIINRLRRANNPKQILVITADREIQQVARQVQAPVQSSSEFANTLSSSIEVEAPPPEETGLTEDEVNEWLDLFQRGKLDRS